MLAPKNPDAPPLDEAPVFPAAAVFGADEGALNGLDVPVPPNRPPPGVPEGVPDVPEAPNREPAGFCVLLLLAPIPLNRPPWPPLIPSFDGLLPKEKPAD